MKLPAGLLLVAITLLTALGCHGGSETGSSKTGALPFPDGFLFGAATAGFQSDMGCPTLPPDVCDDTRSDWYQFVTSPEMLASGRTFLSGDDPSAVGPGHWELFETDLDLAARECNHNAFRMSIEWSRIFPDSTIGVEGYENLRAAADARAVAHYHEVFRAMKARGLTPLVTLHHYTLPVWIHDAVGCSLDFECCSPRGWVDRETTVHEIAKYAGFAAREFGGEVDLWGTLNEPFAVLLSGFLLPTPMRTNPPVRLLDGPSFFTAFEAMVEAHARMYDAVKANDRVDARGDGHASQVGVIYAIAPVLPRDPDSPLDRQAAENVFHLWNTAFMDAVALGRFDARLDGRPVFREDLAGRSDFLGMNYKVSVVVEGLPFTILPDLSPLATFNPLTLSAGLIEPRGIYDMTDFFTKRYGIPIIVTENNGQSVPRGDMETEIRIVVEKLSWLSHAIARGVDVRGYFYWSLTDNYEWNHGTGVRLGLYRVDPDDPAKGRTPRETVDVYAAIAAAGAVPADMAARYPVDFEGAR